MINNARELLVEIARCPNFCAAVTDKTHPCNKIATNKNQPTERHLPEPWCGDIENAEVLFISSNPSIDPSENFPIASWNDDDIVDFFEKRFYDPNYKNRFFTVVLKIANWILNNINTKPTKEENLKKCIAITEVVHCKSKGEEGVADACNTCVEKWLRKILNFYNGQYVVVLGKKAKTLIAPYITCLNGKTVIYLDHPSYPVSDAKRIEEIRK